MKRILQLIILLLICLLLGLWSPWLSLNISISDIFGVEEPERISGLQVISLSGDLNVYLDNQLADGKAEFPDKPLIIDKIEPGERLVRIERQTSVKNAYWSMSRIIKFEEGKEVIISYNLGPEEEFSEGVVIYATKSSVLESGRATVKIKANTEDFAVKLDDLNFSAQGDIATEKINLNKQYKLTITKQGFEKLELTILPSTQEDRNKLEGYDINIDAQLMYQPITVE